MIDDKQQVDRMKEALIRSMKIIPPSVVNGSYQRAVQYRSDFVKAQKILKKRTPQINELGWAINAMKND